MHQISHSSLQFIKQMLSEQITEVSDILADLKADNGELWLSCDPDDTSEDSTGAFALMNATRDNIRYLQKHLNSLTKAQTEIKRAISTGSV